MNRYRVLLPLQINGHEQGEEFDHDFEEAIHELDAVQSGLLEIVPREYRVIVEDARIHDTPTGEVFTAAMLMENEAALVNAGMIERVEEKPAPKPTRKKKEKED